MIKGPSQLAAALVLIAAACGTTTASPSTPAALPPTAALPTPARITALAPSPTAPAPTATSEPTATPTSLFAPVTGDDWQVGPGNARITIVEYGDFQ